MYLIPLFRGQANRPLGVSAEVDPELFVFVQAVGSWHLSYSGFPYKPRYHVDADTGGRMQYNLHMNRFCYALAMREPEKRQELIQDDQVLYDETNLDGPYGKIKHEDGNKLNCKFGNLSTAVSARTRVRRKTKFGSEQAHKAPYEIENQEHARACDEQHGPDIVLPPAPVRQVPDAADVIKQFYSKDKAEDAE